MRSLEPLVCCQDWFAGCAAEWKTLPQLMLWLEIKVRKRKPRMLPSPKRTSGMNGERMITVKVGLAHMIAMVQRADVGTVCSIAS